MKSGAVRFITLLATIVGAISATGDDDTVPGVRRLTDGPIVAPATDPSIGTNINGPSLIRVPAWVERPLGAYYLYFADHHGKYIRMAYADRVRGPWKVHRPGTLQLAQSHFSDHIASPDVVVDDERHQIRMYYHGLSAGERTQHTRVAVSTDGLSFAASREPVGRGSAYWRVFRRDGWWYALAMPGRLLRSRDGLTPFEAGPQLFPAAPIQVHNGLVIRGDMLHVFYTRAGDTPERIMYSRVGLDPDWNLWRSTPPRDVLKPETPWEGADLPVTPAKIGALDGRSHALRDPTVFADGSKTYLLYAVAGESGIAIAELLF